MIQHPCIALVLAGLALAGCTPANGPPATPPGIQAAASADAPHDARPGACYGKIVSPAVYETVTEHIVIAPAETGAGGTIITPAKYRTETRQRVVGGGRPTFFETPCPDVITQDFVASLQRALKARRLLTGPITGIIDQRTEAAILAFQEPLGLKSSTLSLESARLLGLIAWEPVEG